MTGWEEYNIYVVEKRLISLALRRSYRLLRERPYTNRKINTCSPKAKEKKELKSWVIKIYKVKQLHTLFILAKI